MKPTESQVREFWEWFEFKLVTEENSIYWLYPNGRYDFRLPEITLNNLDKYAIPKLVVESIHFSWGNNEILCWLYIKSKIGKKFQGTSKDFTLALFWAIWEVIKEK